MANDSVKSIRIERRGGLAGRPASVDLAAADLNAAQRQALSGMLALAARRSGGSGSSSGPPSPGADRYRFRVHVSRDDGSVQLIEVGEDEMPDALAALVKMQLP
jgi:hypothetical protein